MVCVKPFVVETLRRNSSNCWEPLTDGAEGNQQESLLKKESSTTSEMRRVQVNSKRGGSQEDLDIV